MMEIAFHPLHNLDYQIYQVRLLNLTDQQQILQNHNSVMLMYFLLLSVIADHRSAYSLKLPQFILTKLFGNYCSIIVQKS